MFQQIASRLLFASTFTAVVLFDNLQAHSQPAIAGEQQPVSVVDSASTLLLGEPLTMNCEIATRLQETFFFTEQDGQPVAVDCLSIISIPEQRPTGGLSPILPENPGETISPPPRVLEILLDRSTSPSDRLTLFRQPL